MTPPRSGPTIMAPVVSAVHSPIARERTGSAIVEVMSARELGTRNAPATPWTARAAISSSIEGAAATATDAMPNPMRPMRSTSRRP